jgi:hypothetical protein
MDTRPVLKRIETRLCAIFRAPAVAILGGLLMLMIASVIACAPAHADDKLILAQKVKIDVVDKRPTLVPVGDGPFKDRFPNGIDLSGEIATQQAGKPAPIEGLTQARIAPGDVKKREFGSIAAAKGSMIRNNTGKDISAIEISTKGMTGGTPNKIDGNSKDGDDFDVKFSPDGKTVRLEAKAGKELKNNEMIWMLIPEGPQPGQPGAKIFEGKVETVAPPAPKAPAPPAPKLPEGKGPGAMMYNPGTDSLSFTPGALDALTYADGTTVLSNSLTETLIGAQLLIEDMQILGSSFSILPGAYQLSDSGLSLMLNGETVLQGGLTDGLLVPDSSAPGMADLYAYFGLFEEGKAGPFSRYLNEHFNYSNGAMLHFRTNILSATGDLTTSGSGTGIWRIASTGTAAPEPATLLLLLGGALPLARRYWRKA